MHVLISFLGRVPKNETGYRATRYRFDGVLDEPTAFVGWSLRRRLTPDRLVILGTAGSMWDHLFEKDIDLGTLAEDERLALQEATETQTVTASLLEPLAPLLAKQLGIEVRLVLIPYCHNEAEQLDLLTIMAEQVEPGDRVSLDVTHGFRHLPMLAMLSAMHLRVVRNAQIQGIYYGAYDPDTGAAPVVDLSGLLHIADWVSSLNTFDKDGDYGVFADLLERDGVPTQQANYLRRAAFRERVSKAWEARSDLRNLDAVLDSGLPGVSALFADQLKTRIRWHKGQDLLACQRELALEYLSRDDYIRATIYAFEGFVTTLIDDQQHEMFWDFRDRDKARKEYQSGLRGEKLLLSDYFLLKGLRNALAHGTRPDDPRIAQKVEGALSDPTALQNELRRLIKKLLPH